MNYKKAYTRINKVDIKKDIETLISKIEKTVIEDIKDLNEDDKFIVFQMISNKINAEIHSNIVFRE
jgi:hypothetical protein